MLTKEHAIAEYERWKILPDRLKQVTHSQYLDYARQMLEIYRQGIGKTRLELHRQIRKVFQKEPDCPSRRIDAFCKLLDDVSLYDKDIKSKAANLRKKVFRLSAPFHPLVKKSDRFFEQDEAEIKEKIARELGKEWKDIQRDIFADVTEYHRLREFSGYPGPREILSRYNIAQIQVALYRAAEMTVWIREDLKTLIRYAKLARLMHTIIHTPDGRYQIKFDGPASVLRNTRRYGVSMAKFFPALAACRGWEMNARITTSRKGFYLQLNLSHRDRLTAHFPPLEEFDSSIEENFAAKWYGGDGKSTEKREGWTLLREGEILHKGQKVFFPDFVLKHDDGRKVYLEIIGFWTPKYLKNKMETLSLFQDHNLLIAIAENLQDRKGMDKAKEVPQLFNNAIIFKTSLHIKDVLNRLDRI